MHMEGTIQLPASCETLWQYLNDPEILQQCIPGCDQIDKISETQFSAVVMLHIGPMKARFNTKITLCDLTPPTYYRLIAEASGGNVGFAKGEATIELIPQETSTTLIRYHAKGQIGGKIMQLGSRLIDATARKLTDIFFERLKTILVGQEVKPKSRLIIWLWRIIITGGVMISLFLLYNWLTS